MLTIAGGLVAVALLIIRPDQLQSWIPRLSASAFVIGLAADTLVDRLGLYRFLGFKNPLPLFQDHS
jgi:hypothetical protein